MAKVLVCYYSGSGNTRKMAEHVAKGAEEDGAKVDLKEVSEITVDNLIDYDAIVLGSPTYYGAPAAEMKKLVDESVKYHGDLEGKVGGAFTSSAMVGGGNETTIRSLLDMLLIHGMVIMGDSNGNHYGPVAIGAPDASSKKECERHGRRIAGLAKKLHG
jgi:NAD(P)H dehydrogenase (quinone)